MIGDGWDGEPSVRPGEFPDPDRDPLPPPTPGVKRVAVVTGSRADFGLLVPVMRAIHAHPGLELHVIAAGSHLVPPALTFRDVKKIFLVADAVPMQRCGRTTRHDDAESTGRGMARFARGFQRIAPDWVMVLGDRIEAFAAASAAAIAGIALAHVHGGDRAEGVADESMRHAITKLAHVHFAATPGSAARIVRMGERPDMVHVVGSPAIDGLDVVEPMGDEEALGLGDPDTLLLMHPVGRVAEHEEAVAAATIEALARAGRRVLAMDPNFDPGREGIVRAIAASGLARLTHMERGRFLSLLMRLARQDGVLVGNSSAALIEGAALRLPAVNIGPRQAGRERAGNVVDASAETAQEIGVALGRALAIDRIAITHPYGEGQAGRRIAELLAMAPGVSERLLRKRCVY